jgi:hypothetical protein
MIAAARIRSAEPTQQGWGGIVRSSQRGPVKQQRTQTLFVAPAGTGRGEAAIPIYAAETIKAGGL